jgi:hypothetical protein
MDIRDKLKDILMRMPRAKLASGGKEVTTICPYCGKYHFYISLPSHEDDVPLFHCFYANCLASGIVTHQTLMSWNIYDIDIGVELTKYNKRVLSLEKNRKFKDSDIYKLNNTFVTDNELSQIKLKYINNRLGINLTYDDLLNKKIVLNLKDLWQCNNITNLTRDARIINQLDESFVGFISQDNAFVNLRNLRPGKVDKSIDMRYVNYNIFGKFDNTQRYYTLPTSIDLCNPNRIKLHISEGAFDILSIYYNLRKDDRHSIYSSILGGGYLGICKHFICALGLINLEIHIYPDNDIDDNVMYEIGQYLYVYQIPLYIHRNIYPDEKDFGVKLENFKEQIRKII